MKIYIINGAPCSGKTTFELFIKDLLGEENCFILSTVDFVKEIARFCGWNGEKTDRDRKFLSDLKDTLTQWNNLPNKKILENIMDISLRAPNAVVFIDCREPDEIEYLCTTLGVESVLIRRANAEQARTSNHADAEVLEYPYDYIIENNGDIKKFEESAITFVKQVIENPIV